MSCRPLAPPQWAERAWAEYASQVVCTCLAPVSLYRAGPPRLYKLAAARIRSRISAAEAAHIVAQALKLRCVSLPCGDYMLAGKGSNGERESWLVFYRAEDLETRKWLCELKRSYEVAEAILKSPELHKLYLAGALPEELKPYAPYVHLLETDGRVIAEVRDGHIYVLVNRTIKLVPPC